MQKIAYVCIVHCFVQQSKGTIQSVFCAQMNQYHLDLRKFHYTLYPGIYHNGLVVLYSSGIFRIFVRFG